jgi:hypothetical protein
LNYHTVRKPQSSKSSTPEKILDFTDRAFLKKIIKELVSVISHEWLEESELSIDIIHLDSPSTYIHCQIHREPFSALYNLVMGINIMFASFAHDLLEYMPLTPTIKLLKIPLGHILPSLGILYVLSIWVKETLVHMSFYIFDINEFDLLKGQPIERLIQEGQTGKLNICLGKNLKLPIY